MDFWTRNGKICSSDQFFKKILPLIFTTRQTLSLSSKKVYDFYDIVRADMILYDEIRADTMAYDGPSSNSDGGGGPKTRDLKTTKNVNF